MPSPPHPLEGVAPGTPLSSGYKPRMRILANTGSDTAAAFLREHLRPGSRLDAATDRLGLFGFEAVEPALTRLASARLLLPAGADAASLLPLGGPHDRARRSGLDAAPLATRAAAFLAGAAEVRHAPTALSGGLFVVRDASGSPVAALQGQVSLSTAGLGLTPAEAAGPVTACSTPEGAAPFAAWFDAQWHAASPAPGGAGAFAGGLEALTAARPPRSLYALTLFHLLRNPDGSGALDEEGLLGAATGVRDTAVWRMLYKFQRDGVVGVVDKLDRHGGCILADSVGLGKTFEALAVLKHHELRNDRCLVLCPKRLRENWTLPLLNDRRNPLAGDRFRYDVLHHTDLSRERGESGDIDLANVHWGNYDLVVIDESHNAFSLREVSPGSSRASAGGARRRVEVVGFVRAPPSGSGVGSPRRSNAGRTPRDRRLEALPDHRHAAETSGGAAPGCHARSGVGSEIQRRVTAPPGGRGTRKPAPTRPRFCWFSGDPIVWTHTRRCLRSRGATTHRPTA